MKLQIWEPKIHYVPVVDMEEKEGKRLELQIGKQNCKLHYLEVANENLMEKGKWKSCLLESEWSFSSSKKECLASLTP